MDADQSRHGVPSASHQSSQKRNLTTIPFNTQSDYPNPPTTNPAAPPTASPHPLLNSNDLAMQQQPENLYPQAQSIPYHNLPQNIPPSNPPYPYNTNTNNAPPSSVLDWTLSDTTTGGFDSTLGSAPGPGDYFMSKSDDNIQTLFHNSFDIWGLLDDHGDRIVGGGGGAGDGMRY